MLSNKLTRRSFFASILLLLGCTEIVIEEAAECDSDLTLDSAHEFQGFDYSTFVE